MATLSPLVQQRLSNQHIIEPGFEHPEAVVRWMGALQAQDYAQAVWAVGLRTASGTLAAVEQAIADKKIVRTWPMRGTLHFVPPEDAGWMLKLSAERMIVSARGRQAQLGLDQSVLERSRQLFYDALQGGRCLTRAEMMALLGQAGISPEKQRGYHILWYAAQTGLICMGPMQNKQQTFVLLAEWALRARDLPREEALSELARRYFTGHGPATLRDFAWWAGLTLTDARAGRAAAGPGLVSQTIDGQEFWLGGELTAPIEKPTHDFHLLPGFDEYLIGYTDRGAVLPSEHAAKIIPGGNGVFQPILVAAGQVVGTWKRRLSTKTLGWKDTVEITLLPFTPLDVPQENILAAARRYSRFLGLQLSLV